jgi:hypothetical protein
MVELFLSFIEGFSLFFLIEVAVLIFLLFLSEEVEHGAVAFVSLLLFYGICLVRHETHYISEPSLLNIIIYILIGLFYALIRLYFSGVSKKTHHWDYSGENKETREKSLAQNKENILHFVKNNFFRWWGIWPVSFLYYIFTDILKQFKEVFLKFTGNMLIKIYEAGRKE